MADVKAATVLDAKPWTGLTLLLLAALLAAGYLWASGAVLDEVTVGAGRVIPSSREQVIQSLEGGILSELTVREGDIVEKDQVLARLDDTRFGASFRESHSRVTALRAANARLRAEASGGTPVFPADARAEQVRVETELFHSRRQQLEESVAALKRSFQLADEELQLTAPLVKKGVVSEVELLRLRRQVNELRANLQDRQNKFRADARADLAKNEAELTAIAEGNAARADQVRRAVLRSPMRGTVKNIRVTTLGGIVQPGQDIMEIVPLEDQLLIEARIKPSDVAFLRPGLPATVKITAYDYSIYGGLEATLVHISADTLRDEKKPDETYYKIQVRTQQSHLKDRDGNALPIIPGMTATVDVLTGHKTVLDYLLKPLLKAKGSALRER
ncbi:MAG: HlyD family type I secretion periplasmic adaptor subunit [Burkholderiales bacterium]|nr:HlyD family type I secretion periplasmic adaptor subunit [Burkholderiales bacterium]